MFHGSATRAMISRVRCRGPLRALQNLSHQSETPARSVWHAVCLARAVLWPAQAHRSACSSEIIQATHCVIILCSSTANMHQLPTLIAKRRCNTSCDPWQIQSSRAVHTTTDTAVSGCILLSALLRKYHLQSLTGLCRMTLKIHYRCFEELDSRDSRLVIDLLLVAGTGLVISSETTVLAVSAVWWLRGLVWLVWLVCG